MGLPVGKLICASNQNNVLADFFSRGVYDRNRTFYTTISPSMDILVSSNLERLLYSVCGSDAEVTGYMSQLAKTGEYKVSDAVKSVIDKHFVGGYCSDADTKAAINKVYAENGYLMDTHTAVAYNKLADYPKIQAAFLLLSSYRPQARISSATAFLRHWGREATLPEQSLSKSSRK